MRLKKNESKEAITYIYQIIQQNNVRFGRSQYFRNKKVNLYILNKRYNIEFFNVIDFKNILYRIFLYIKTIYQISNPNKFFLFASTNPIYNEILQNAAINAMMKVHNTRWICGTISRRTNFFLLKNSIQGMDKVQKQRVISSLNFFFNYKKIVKAYYVESGLLGIFIPDLENNLMIIKEAITENIPIIGIVNSTNIVEINYPIFGNSRSVFSVFFFSHLISYWIKINLKKYRGISKFYLFKKKKKKNILKKIKNKIAIFKAFKKYYIKRIYRFGRRFTKSRNTHISLFIFGIHDGEFELNNYKKKWFAQKHQRDLDNVLFFSYKTPLALQQRLTVLNSLLLNNLSGTISWSQRLLGNFFWLNLRRLLIQRRRLPHKAALSRNLLWIKASYLLKKKKNYNFNKQDKIVNKRRRNYKSITSNKKQGGRAINKKKKYYKPTYKNKKQW